MYHRPIHLSGSPPNDLFALAAKLLRITVIFCDDGSAPERATREISGYESSNRFLERNFESPRIKRTRIIELISAGRSGLEPATKPMRFIALERRAQNPVELRQRHVVVVI